MRIRDIRTTIVGTPWRELVFFEALTDNGLTGVSEVRMVNKTDTLVACIQELAPRYLLGSDPFDVERLAWNIQTAEYGRPGEVTQSTLAASTSPAGISSGSHSVTASVSSCRRSSRRCRAPPISRSARSRRCRSPSPRSEW